jgi:hypothetical protein
MNENLYESQFSIDKYAYDDDAEMMMMAVWMNEAISIEMLSK